MGTTKPEVWKIDAKSKYTKILNNTKHKMAKHCELFDKFIVHCLLWLVEYSSRVKNYINKILTTICGSVIVSQWNVEFFIINQLFQNDIYSILKINKAFPLCILEGSCNKWGKELIMVILQIKQMFLCKHIIKLITFYKNKSICSR